MLIKLDSISFSYENSTEALLGIKLEICTGECIALTGHNGSGKSTLVKHLNGLLRPTSGTISINDEDTSTYTTAQLAGKVALLFQNPDDQICKRTVWDEIAFGPKNLGYSIEKTKTLTKAAITLFGLTGFERKNPHDCGYSERKRIAMASIVAMDTPILVFDEPTAGLDPYEINLLITALRKLKDKNKTTIIISHDMDFVAENINRVITLSQGKKIFDGKARDLFKNENVVEICGLQHPQVVQLGRACHLDYTALNPAEFVFIYQHK